MIDFPAPDNATWDEAIAYTRRFVKRWKGHPRITPAVAPHSAYTVSAEHLQQAHRLAEELDLSEDHIDELKEKAEEAQKEYEKKVAKLREEMKDDVLGAVLTKEQMEKFEELMGEPMTLDMSRFGRGGRGGGDRGGRVVAQGHPTDLARKPPRRSITAQYLQAHWKNRRENGEHRSTERPVPVEV